MRRGIRIPAWQLLLVAVLGILSKCESLRDLERFSRRHHAVLTDTLGIELKRPPSDSAFRYLFLQVDVAFICAAIRDWTLAQIPGNATDLDQLVCDGKKLRGSIESTAAGGSAFIAQVTLYSAALGLAIAQGCCATNQGNEQAELKKLLGELDLEGVLIQVDPLHSHNAFFDSSRSRGADFFLSIKGNEKTLQRQVSRQFEGERQIPFAAMHHEIGHGCEITWAMRAKEAPVHIKANWPGSACIMELLASGSRDVKPFKARHLFITSLRTTPEALLFLIRERWSIEGWHWIRDTQFHEDKHRHRGNGAGALATLRTAALNLLRLAGFDSIREGLHAVMHDIKALLAMAMRQPQEKPS